jgi:uncharacterized spore protein YtfJ
MNAIHTILDMTIEGMTQLADSDIVTGKQIQVGDKSIVPILKLSMGIGGAGGKGEGEGKDPKKSQTGKGTGLGGGAGGSVHLTPMAVIVKDKSGVKILKVPSAKGNFEKLMDKLPGFVEKIKAVADSD